MTILGRDGAAGLKIGTLCREMGVTSGSFYHHFEGWSGFVRELLGHWEAEQTERIVARTAGVPDPIQRIDVLKRLTVDLPHGAESAIRTWSNSDPAVDAVLRRVDAQRSTALQRVVNGVVTDPRAAHRLTALGMSILIGFQLSLAGTEPTLLADLLDEYEQLLLRHAGTPSPISARQPPAPGQPRP